MAINKHMLNFHSEQRLVSNFHEMIEKIVKVSQNMLEDDDISSNHIHAHVINQMIVKMMDRVARIMSG